MGILNLTPDSFSGDGASHRVLDEVVAQAEQMIADGARILDIGGESTRPGADVIDAEEETRRVVPLVEMLAKRVAVPLSVDTTKALVAQRVLDVGAHIINDVSGATADDKMLEVLAQNPCGIVLMHRRGTSQTMKASQAAVGSGQSAENAHDIIAEVLAFWRERVEAAQNVGIAPERIALDAGFGFGKSVDENLEILRRGRELSDFGFPTLSGTSRKSTIGRVLDPSRKEGARVEERIFGTAATVAIAIAAGADIVRVHDVREMAQVVRMVDAIR